ncbi:class I SAM-dependent methyltransferase [Pseudoalteromonas sp. GB56]
MSDNINFYSVNAESLATQYDKVPFELVHKDWINELPSDGVALDVGAGSGRDARYLAARGLSVVAVEPAEGIREVAQRYVTSHSIHWLNDRLPDLANVFTLQMKFDLILLSAVWMHIPPSQRERSFRKLSSLLKPNGRIVISLRHGSCEDERCKMFVKLNYPNWPVNLVSRLNCSVTQNSKMSWAETTFLGKPLCVHCPTTVRARSPSFAT